MLRTIDYVQLDDDTKAYLREVRNRNGNGAPGVFHGISNGKPMLAFLAGLVILPLFVWAGYSSNKPAYANAMLQTAGVLLGGWLMLYAVRRWTAGGDKYVGKFFYFDPEYVYVGEGEQLKFAELDSNTAIEPVGASALRFDNDRAPFVIPLPNRALALYVANYYDALDHLYGNTDDRSEVDGRWANLSAAEKGAVAKYMVRNDQLPQNLNDVELDIDRMPEEVRPKRGGGGLGFLRYLLILAAGAGAFFAFKTTNAPIHDNASFAAVKPNSPADLRHYLNDDKNTAHRDEALELLKKQYDGPIQTVREKATDAELKEGFVKLLDSLRGPDTPAVSLGVTDRDGGLSSWADGLRTRFADGIGTAVGKEHIVFVQKPDGKPALIDISYSSADAKKLTWTVELRLTPDDANPYLKASREYKPQPGMPALQPSEAVYQDVMLKMVGSAPAAPPPLPVDNDW